MRASLLRGTTLVALAATIVTPAAATAQVGHLPDQSPYQDVKLGQSLTIMGGWLAVKRDPAGVAPEASLFGQLRYDINVGGPASLFVRYALAPSERNVLVPTNPRATRVIGTTNASTHLAEGGLDIALTGRKTWRNLLPSVNGGVGLAGNFAKADTGSYRFGTKFAFSYGLSVRYLPKRGPQLRVDVTNFLWQYQYPDRYFVRAADTTAVLNDTRQREAWRGNWGLSVGAVFPIFR